MRYKIVLVLILFSNVAALAQKLSFSANASVVSTGMIISSQELPVSINFKNQLNLSFGLKACYLICDKYCLQAELSYYHQSGELSFDYAINTSSSGLFNVVNVRPSATISMPILSMPVMFGYVANKHLTILVGGYISRRGDTQVELNSIAARAVNEQFSNQQISDETVESITEQKLDSNLHKFDVGLSCEIYYRVSKKLAFNLSYRRSLFNLSHRLELQKYLYENLPDIPKGIKITPRMNLSVMEIGINYIL